MSNYWDYEYIPELAELAIPRELQESAYATWKKAPSKETMSNLQRTFGKLLNSELGRYQGTLARPFLRSFAKKYVADAVRTYNPTAGTQLSTHILNNLQRLHRINYQNVQGLRTPEDLQAKINTINQTRINLGNELGREPNDDEVATRLKIPIKQIQNFNKQVKLEYTPQTDIPTLHTETTPEDDVLDYVHFDLPPIHKKILEYKTGYQGSPKLSNTEIGKKLNISPVRISQISKAIGNKIKTHLGCTHDSA